MPATSQTPRGGRTFPASTTWSSGSEPCRQFGGARLQIAPIVLASNAVAVAFTIVLGLSKTGNPSRYFGEGRFTTAISCFQLLVVAALAMRIFYLHTGTGVPVWRGALIWLLVAMGFMFLAADEGFELHERMDGGIHSLFGINKTALSDRIDDAIIAVYAFIGSGVLLAYRGELLSVCRIVPWLVAGFLVTGFSIACDACCNRGDILLWLLDDVALAKRAEGWVATLEGSTTLLAEGLFVIAFSCVARDAQNPVTNKPRQHELWRDQMPGYGRPD